MRINKKEFWEAMATKSLDAKDMVRKVLIDLTHFNDKTYPYKGKVKISERRIYFNDTIWGNFIPSPQKEDILLLIKKATSYNKILIDDFSTKMDRLGYKVTVPIKRKLFKYSIEFGRIVPLYQRLLSYKQVKTATKYSYRTDSKLTEDIILYKDEDLELMKQFSRNELFKSAYIDLSKMIENKQKQEDNNERKEN